MNNQWDFFVSLLKQEVVPALGCTEPVTVALAAAQAVRLLGQPPEFIEVALSGNLLKNAMGVGVPGTGMCGAEIAAAVGALGGNPDIGLETLRDITPEHVTQAKQMLTDGRVKVVHAEGNEALFAAASVKAGEHSARAVIRGGHINLVLLEKDGVVTWKKDESPIPQAKKVDTFTVSDIYAFATKAPLSTLAFILEAARMNMVVANEGLRGDYGLKLGKTINSNIDRKLLADDACNHALKLTAAAIDARMDGVMLPVMSNSGSGDQGITCTLPVVAFAEKLNATEEQLARALVMSHLTAVHIKQHIGRLSALCGTIVAATGASCGIVLLLGGTLAHCAMAINNMIGNMTGMICDGAKNSCALKANSSVSAAVHAAFLAIADQGITGMEGIVADDAEESIRNLGRLTKEGMLETDKVILDIMVNKQK